MGNIARRSPIDTECTPAAQIQALPQVRAWRAFAVAAGGGDKSPDGTKLASSSAEDKMSLLGSRSRSMAAVRYGRSDLRRDRRGQRGEDGVEVQDCAGLADSGDLYWKEVERPADGQR